MLLLELLMSCMVMAYGGQGNPVFFIKEIPYFYY